MPKRPPVLAHVRFDARRDEFRRLDLEATFERIYTTNLWGSAESVSGLGSAPAETRALRATLLELLKDLHVRTLIDAPLRRFRLARRRRPARRVVRRPRHRRVAGREERGRLREREAALP